MENILKHSVRRHRHTAAEIHKLLQQYRGSGLTQRQFAQQASLGYSTLTAWLRRAKRGQLPKAHALRLLPVELLPGSGPAARGYHVQWPDGVSLHVGPGFAVQEVRQLVELLRPCSR